MNSYWDVIEAPFVAFGLNTGLKRFAFVSLLTSIALWQFQPVAFFDEKGNPRPWSILKPDDENAIPLDWMTFSLVIGASTALFI